MGMYAVGKLIGGFLEVREGFVGLEEGQEAFTEAEVCCGGGRVATKRFPMLRKPPLWIIRKPLPFC